MSSPTSLSPPETGPVQRENKTKDEDDLPLANTKTTISNNTGNTTNTAARASSPRTILIKQIAEKIKVELNGGSGKGLTGQASGGGAIAEAKEALARVEANWTASSEDTDPSQIQNADKLWNVMRPCLVYGSGVSVKTRLYLMDLVQKLFAHHCWSEHGMIRESSVMANATREHPSKLRDRKLSMFNVQLEQSLLGFDMNQHQSTPEHGVASEVSGSEAVPDQQELNASKASLSSNSNPSKEQEAGGGSNVYLLDDIIAVICDGVGEEAIEVQLLKILLTAITTPSLRLSGLSILIAIRTCFIIYVSSKVKVNAMTAKASLNQMVHEIFSSMEKSIGASDPPTSSVSNVPETQASVALIHILDTRRHAYSVLDYLIRLSMISDAALSAAVSSGGSTGAALRLDQPELAKEVVSSNATAIRSLSFELILSTLATFGPQLQNEPAFMKIVRFSLCISISRNFMSSEPVLFELALSILLLVIRFYRHRLKTEVEVLLSTLLHILDMNTCPYKQKSLIFQALQRLCEKPQILADIFLNYDCDLIATSIFERIISVCCRIARGHDLALPPPSSGIIGYVSGMDSKNEIIRSHDRRLKLRALCVLIDVVSSLSEWATGESSAGLGAPGAVGRSDQPSRLNTENSPLTRTNLKSSFEPSVHGGVVIVSKNPLVSIPMRSDTPNLAESSLAKSTEALDTLESITNRKQRLQQAIKLFNHKPSKGLNALFEFVEKEPLAVAQFLLNNSGLTKAAIGEYIGEADAFNIKVMHAFIDSLSFAGRKFVDALRSLLQTFRLPGEAQKIDRIMEKFADRYCATNPDLFAKADTAYTLAYSVIMLNTDQHSKQVKHRMDAAAFIKNNRGINDSGDLPDEFLTDIFVDISGNEIIMEEEHIGRLDQMAISLGAGGIDEDQRMEAYQKELKHLEKKNARLIRSGASGDRDNSSAEFKSATQSDLARPMFLVLSWPAMAAFSCLFEAAVDSDDLSADLSTPYDAQGEPKCVDLCLHGFSRCISIASFFKIQTERDAFMTSLSGLTSLSNIYDMKIKNVKAIKTLIGVGSELGEYLDGSWHWIIETLAIIERIESISTSNSTTAIADGSNTGSSGLLIQTKEKGILEKMMQEMSHQTMVVAMDRMFSGSIELSSTSIVSFFRELVRVTLDQLGIDQRSVLLNAYVSGEDRTARFSKDGPQAFKFEDMTTKSGRRSVSLSNARSLVADEAPRMYLVKKVVELAYYNMRRIRYEWSMIWKILYPFFLAISCHPSLDISTFGVESLRQLCVKLLEREELEHFATQNEYLRTFEAIVRQNPSLATREMIISSLSFMIQGCKLKSGWKSVFGTLSKMARDPNEALQMKAFQLLADIHDSHIFTVVQYGGLVDYVSCVDEFALGSVEEVVVSSVELLQNMAKTMHDLSQSAPPLSTSVLRSSSINSMAATKSPTVPTSATGSVDIGAVPYYSSGGTISEEHFFLKWFPILSSFSRILSQSEALATRMKCLDALFDTLQAYGGFFDACYWKPISRNIVLPIFSDLHELEEESGAENQSSTSLAVSLHPRIREGNISIWIHGLQLLVELMSEFHKIFTDQSGVVLESFLSLILNFLGKKDEKLAMCGGACLQQYLKLNMSKFNGDIVWRIVTTAIQQAFEVTAPSELLLNEPVLKTSSSRDRVVGEGLRLTSQDHPNPSQQPSPTGRNLDHLDFEHTIIKCVAHLDILQAIRDVCLGVNFSVVAIPREYRDQWFACIYDSYLLARSFNANYELRYEIWKKGLVQQMPNLIKQETISFSIWVQLSFIVFRHEDPAGNGGEGSLRVIDDTLWLFERFATYLSDAQKYIRDLSLWSPVIAMILDLVTDTDELWHRKDGNAVIAKYYFRSIPLMGVESIAVRVSLAKFLNKVGRVYFLHGNSPVPAGSPLSAGSKVSPI